MNLNFGQAVNSADTVTADIKLLIVDMFEYHRWDEQKIEKGKAVREALMKAVEVIVENVPPGPDRTVAIRKIREARMDCNSAITHDGKY